ncbi:VPS35 endosomal protein sorting factor-like [Condylostylus longicornis]|uniref:VPS35 endosomal protein sorting factor-like n=1 Tax=Condylostylus longicornis TaxID=2530218 RepID=UPI00244E3A69|nr:VPS35 endosomal protein sorting factor-like [Condylostylus longicornis]
MSSDWVCLNRDFVFQKHYLQSNPTLEHPLKQIQVAVIESKGTRGKFSSGLSSSSSRTSSTISLIDPLGLNALDGIDPLSQFAQESATDPLSQIVAEYEKFSKKSKNKDMLEANKEYLSWNNKRLGILNKFTTSEKLSITTSFLSGGEMIKTQTTVSDKVKYRLEQLDDFDESSVRHMMDLTQQEYITRIEQLNQELVQSWNGDQRVKALKIAIQCSKMLSDTSVLQFYPSQFVLITDILDIFGKLVYERLRTKADHVEPGRKSAISLPEKFTPEMVPDSAKETCQNWFFKIASIRELLPRLYVEMAILKCYSFLTQSEFNSALLRLTKMIRGIGDPLIATYARCYLVRVGLNVSNDKEYIKENLQDFLAVYGTIFNGSIRSEINRQRIDISSYLALYGPALNWILQGFAYCSTDANADEILNTCKDKKNNGPLLYAILSSFKPEFIANRALDLVKILSNCNTEGISKGQLLRNLGVSLNRCPPPQEQRHVVYIAALNMISTFTNPAEYVSCIEMWAQYVAEHFTLQEVNTLLEDIHVRLSQNKIYENYYGQLQSIMDKIVRYSTDFEGLLTCDSFLLVLDLFQKDSIKLEVCKNIIVTYKNNFEGTTSDPVVTNALMYLCKVLNDSVNALTVDDERRLIGNLISNFIKKVDYGKDFEQQLTFYVEARAAFPNLDAVFTTLVLCVNKLAIETSKIVNGHHTRKTAAFVKACAAYCFITIPSIISVATQMDLYLLSGQVALMNLCLGQADACFETALNLVAELPRTTEIEGKLKSTESYLVSYLCNMLSTLVVVPDSPDQEVLYLVRLLLDVLKKYPFDLHSSGPTLVYLHSLDMLFVESLDIFPYHIPNVVSNDELYGSDPKFIAEVNILCSQIVDQILVQLKSMGDANQLRQQANLALELFSRVLRYSDLMRDKTFMLAINLWNLALKYEQADSKTLAKLLKMTEDYKTKFYGNPLYMRRIEELISRMKLKL